MRFRRRLLTGAWLASGLVLLSAVTARAADSYTNFAKTYIASVTAPGSPWTGPTTGPVAQANKSVIFVDYDERNSGGRGVGQAAAEAAKIIGWQYRVLDGQGTIQGQTAALTQAIALKPDGIILGSVDALGMNSLIQQAIDHGISVVSWHSGMTPGKIKGSNIFTNVTTDPVQVGKVAGLYAVADSGGKANVILFTDSAYAITIAKTDAEEAAIKPCGGCKVLAVEDTPLGDVHDRMPELTTALLTMASAGLIRSQSTTCTMTSWRRPCRPRASLVTVPRTISRRVTGQSRRSSALPTSSIRLQPSPSHSERKRSSSSTS
jgi:ribose transport system substrate-binding protein